MTGPTHKAYSVTFAFITAMLFYKLGVTEINYYFALIILLMSSKHGAKFPDVDHHWKNVGDKTVPNKIINTIIRATGGKHRSWQTHSWDICLVFTIASYQIPRALYNTGKISNVNKEVMNIILLGFASGWISHMISDMLTSAGVQVLCFSKKKIALVPKSIGKLRFNTGNEWEAFNYKTIKIINIILGLTCLIYPYILQGKLSWLKDWLIQLF